MSCSIWKWDTKQEEFGSEFNAPSYECQHNLYTSHKLYKYTHNAMNALPPPSPNSPPQNLSYESSPDDSHLPAELSKAFIVQCDIEAIFARQGTYVNAA